MQKTWVQFLNWEDPLEKGMATHSSILAWRIPWTDVSLGLLGDETKTWETGMVLLLLLLLQRIPRTPLFQPAFLS